MRNKINMIAGLALSLCVVLASAGESQAFWKKMLERGKRHHDKKELKTDNTFTASGVYTGSIEGFIKIGKRKVFVGENTSIYVSGDNGFGSGHFVNRASVYAGGIVENGIAQAAFVVVRPAEASFMGGRTPAMAAANAGHLTRSVSNPNVGVLHDGYE